MRMQIITSCQLSWWVSCIMSMSSPKTSNLCSPALVFFLIDRKVEERWQRGHTSNLQLPARFQRSAPGRPLIFVSGSSLWLCYVVRVLACSVGDARTSSSLSPYVPVKLACCLLSSDFTEDQSLLPAFQSWKVFQSSSSDASCWCGPGARAWLPIMLVSGSWIDKFCFAACMVLSAFLLCVFACCLAF